MATTEVECTTGRCGYGEPCRCDFYANWLIYPPPRLPTTLLRNRSYTRGYCDGHRVGYTLGHQQEQKENSARS